MHTSPKRARKLFHRYYRLPVPRGMVVADEGNRAILCAWMQLEEAQHMLEWYTIGQGAHDPEQALYSDAVTDIMHAHAQALHAASTQASIAHMH